MKYYMECTEGDKIFCHRYVYTLKNCRMQMRLIIFEHLIIPRIKRYHFVCSLFIFIHLKYIMLVLNICQSINVQKLPNSWKLFLHSLQKVLEAINLVYVLILPNLIILRYSFNRHQN